MLEWNRNLPPFNIIAFHQWIRLLKNHFSILFSSPFYDEKFGCLMERYNATQNTIRNCLSFTNYNWRKKAIWSLMVIWQLVAVDFYFLRFVVVVVLAAIAVNLCNSQFTSFHLTRIAVISVVGRLCWKVNSHRVLSLDSRSGVDCRAWYISTYMTMLTCWALFFLLFRRWFT